MKSLRGSNIDPAFHPSEVYQISTRISFGLSGKKSTVFLLRVYSHDTVEPNPWKGAIKFKVLWRFKTLIKTLQNIVKNSKKLCSSFKKWKKNRDDCQWLSGISFFSVNSKEISAEWLENIQLNQLSIPKQRVDFKTWKLIKKNFFIGKKYLCCKPVCYRRELSLVTKGSIC